MMEDHLQRNDIVTQISDQKRGSKQSEMATKQQIWAGPKFIHVRGAGFSSLVFHALLKTKKIPAEKSK